MSTTRHDEMKEQVQRFHNENPRVWDLFIQFTLDRIHKGFNNYSVNAVFERIRWEFDTLGTKDVCSFKLNNNYRAFYARRFMRIFPQYDGFFRTREQTSKQSDRTNLSELTPRDYE
jgi:hypothetical protein|tara:strand:- start:1422 stop:1769 length:348 start_codon:yes stop_codon:yes gene_type:complete